MNQLITILPSLLRGVLKGKKQYTTGALLALLGVGVLTGYIDPDAVTQGVTPPASGEAPAPAPAPSNELLGVVSLLLGANSMANRAAVAKSAAAAEKPSA